MPAKNIHPDAAVAALKNDGWAITHDPYRLSYGSTDMYVDLGAEKSLVGAEKSGRRIAVEVQSFLGASSVRALQEAVGQYEVYPTVLADRDPGRMLYMAVSSETHEEVLADKLGQFIISRLHLRVLVLGPLAKKIIKWID